MKSFYLSFVCVFFLGFSPLLSAQDIIWKAGLHSFFDNTEFSGSSVQIPQTMAGVHLAPEIGLSWQKKHRILAGIDVLHESGSEKAISYYDVVLYYEYAGKPFRFYAGAFPRQLALNKYPRMFFQDSINNYRPVLNGIFWEFNAKTNYANVWLDWVSQQTDKEREAFFMGWSGRYNRKPFYIQHFGYMFHFAKTKNRENHEPLHDNGLILTSLGLDLASGTSFEKLEVNAGWSSGFERNRETGVWNTPQGLLSELKVEYKGLELFNTYYKGRSQQVFRNEYGNALYWGDPVYRTKEYDRIDFCIHFIKTSVVNLKFQYSLHLAERQMYHEQAFYAAFDLDNLKNKKQEKKYRYLWNNWF
jgi:hypothetical protein